MNGNPAANASIPDIVLPRAPDPALNPAAYLRSIHAVRERSRLVMAKAKHNRLAHFTVDMSKFGETASYVVSIIKVRLGGLSMWRSLANLCVLIPRAERLRA